MSGDRGKYKKGKKAEKEVDMNGDKVSKRRSKEPSSSAGLCVKTFFFMTLSTFVLTATLIYIDYQPGQLKEAYLTQIPPEVRVYLDESIEQANIVWNDLAKFTSDSWRQGNILARQWSRNVNFGNFSLEEILFADEIYEEQIQERKEATNKLKEAISAINQKIQEQKEKESEEQNIEEGSDENLLRKEEERLSQEAEAKKAKEEQQKQEALKAEEEKKRLEEKAKKIEEERKRQEEAKKAEEERKRQEEAKKAAEERKRQEEVKKAEEERKRQEEAKKAEEERKKQEEAMKAEEERKKQEEDRKAEEERKKQEEARKAEEEQKKKEEARKAEEERKRQEEEAKKAEEEQKKQEEARKAEEERKRQEEEAIKAEEERKRQEEEARKAEEERKRQEEEARKAEEERKKQEEARKAEEEQKKQEARKAEEERKRQEEEARKAEEEQKKQEARKAEEERKRQEEEARKAEEEKKRQEEEARKAEEEIKRLEEEAKKAEEERKRQEEEARKAEDERMKQEEARKAEEEKKKLEEEARKANEERKRQEAKKAEEEQKVKEEETKKAEEERKRQEEEDKKAEELRKIQEAQKAEEDRKRQEEARKAEAEKKRQQEEAERAAEEKKRQEEHARKVEEEKRRLEEAEKKRQEAADEERKKQEEEDRKAQEERKKLNEEAKKPDEERKPVKEGKNTNEERKKPKEPSKKNEEQPVASDGTQFQENDEQPIHETASVDTKPQPVDDVTVKASLDETNNQKESISEPKPSPNILTLETYSKKEITNAQDFLIRHHLDRLDQLIIEASGKTHPSEQLKSILEEFNHLLISTHYTSPRSIYGKARVLDLLAHEDQSNSFLDESIKEFRHLLSLGSSVPQELFKKGAKRCSQLMEFRGWITEAIKVQKVLADKFPNDTEFLNKLGVLYLTTGNNKAASTAFKKVLLIDTTNNFAKVHLGFIMKSEGSASKDFETLDRGVQFLKEGLASKDKEVLDGRFFLSLGDGLRRLGRPQEADMIFQDGVDYGLFPSFWQRSLYNVDGLQAKPLWTLEETGIGHQLQEIARNWEVIKQEALEILHDEKQSGFVTENENLSDKGHWAQFDLYRQGRRVDEHCARAPATCKLVENASQIISNRRGQVKFSVMSSGVHVYPHAGPTNCRLRAHLGLSLPRSEVPPKKWSGLRVADKFLSWTEGEIFVFDDSFDHEVWNEIDQRLILIVDLWHPQLSQELRDTLPPL